MTFELSTFKTLAMRHVYFRQMTNFGWYNWKLIMQHTQIFMYIYVYIFLYVYRSLVIRTNYWYLNASLKRENIVKRTSRMVSASYQLR